MSFRLTREQLYELVWSEAMQRLAKHIGISDVAIAKHCRKVDVPVPERGYWNKLQAGQKLARTALPPRDLGTINRVEMSGTLGAELRARITGEPGVDRECEESIDVLAERFRVRLGKVSVPRGFSNTHPLIAKLLAKDEKPRQEFASRPYSWNQPHFDPAFERRRLRFLNGVFLGFAKIGATPWLRGDDARELAIYMGNASVSFELDAVGAKTHARRGAEAPRDDKARLYLSVSQRARVVNVTTRWEDRDGCPLEDQITEVIVGMAIAGEHLHRQWIVEQEAWQKKQKEEEERRAHERKAEVEQRERECISAMEKAKRDALLADAIAWREADTIRAYVAAARSAAAGKGDIGTFDEWTRWALAEANRLDPISSGRVSVAWSAQAESAASGDED
jgi:hypothetical protein